MAKKWKIHDWGRAEYLDGATMQCVITEGDYPRGRTVAYCDPENAALLRSARELRDTLLWVRKNYAAGPTAEINARIDAALKNAK